MMRTGTTKAAGLEEPELTQTSSSWYSLQEFDDDDHFRRIPVTVVENQLAQVPADGKLKIADTKYPEHFGNVEHLPIEGKPPFDAFPIGSVVYDPTIRY
ncbi:hypothetical protein V8E54_007113 [Elaphomyces granulatus]